jgi:hypothetical protein
MIGKCASNAAGPETPASVIGILGRIAVWVAGGQGGCSFGRASESAAVAHTSGLRRGLDRFYQEPENLMIPISDSLVIFQLKVNGATQAEIETKMTEIRRRIKETEELLKKK